MPRADTREICGNDRTGFAYLYNWALLPPGVHTGETRPIRETGSSPITHPWRMPSWGWHGDIHECALPRGPVCIEVLALIAEVLAADTKGRVVMFAANHEILTDRFVKRLAPELRAPAEDERGGELDVIALGVHGWPGGSWQKTPRAAAPGLLRARKP